MEIARGAVKAHAIPVEDTVGGIGVLLDLVDEESRSDGVKSPGGDEDRVAGLRAHGVDLLFDRSVDQGVFESRSCGTIFKTDVELGSGIAVGDIPHFGFGVASEIGGNFLRRVNLDGEIIAGVEDFDEKGEAVAGEIFSEDLLAVGCPKIM